jgi:hypothetical protein
MDNEARMDIDCFCTRTPGMVDKTEGETQTTDEDVRSVLYLQPQ